MASAAITITNNPATIESDANEKVITKNTELPELRGNLVNGGSNSVWLKFSLTTTAPSSVPVTNAQAQLIVELPPGASLPWLKHYRAAVHKCDTGLTSALFWYPAHGQRD